MLLYDVRKKIDEGFTLIEMIAAVIIVGILASIAAPNLLGMLNQARVKDALGQVEGAIKESQRLAMRRGKTCRIRFIRTVPTGGSYEKAVAQVHPDESGVSYSGCLLSTRELDREIVLEFETETAGTKTKRTIGNTDANSLDIVFSGKGNTNDASQGTIIVSRTNTNLQKCLQIEGILGNILTGNYVDTDADGTADDCDAN